VGRPANRGKERGRRKQLVQGREKFKGSDFKGVISVVRGGELRKGIAEAVSASRRAPERGKPTGNTKEIFSGMHRGKVVVHREECRRPIRRK